MESVLQLSMSTRKQELNINPLPLQNDQKNWDVRTSLLVQVCCPFVTHAIITQTIFSKLASNF